MKVLNYYRYSEHISLSGLPSPEDFQEIKNEGFEIVISLCMPSDSIRLENEGAILTELGLIYIHIPVDFEAPKLKDYELFESLLDTFKGKKLWIHCAKNYRVSAFMYLYAGAYHDKTLLEKYWTPNETWQKFISMRKKYSK